MAEVETQRKVALVGTSRVGKTSIIEELKKRHGEDENVRFVEEAARIYFNLYPEIPVDLRFSLRHQSKIQELALRFEKEAHATSAKSLLTDRSVLDAPAYIRVFGDRNGSHQLIERVRDWIPTYSAILLLSPDGIPYEKDAVRLEDPEVRQRNHEGFLELFLEEGIEYTLLDGGLDQRINAVENLLGKKL